MTVEQILQIAGYVVAGLAVIFSIVQFIYNRVTGSKSKFLTNFMGLLEEISASLGFAEQMTNLKGNDKKEFAQKTIAMYCENRKIKITDEQLNNAIETLIKLTKKVNAREKDLIEANDELVGDAKTNNGISATNKPDIQSDELV